MNYASFSRSIRELPVSPVYLLVGPDDYLINLTADTIYSRTSRRNTGGTEKHRFHADSTRANAALAPAENMGLFSSAVVVIIHDVESYREQDSRRLAAYIKRPNPSATLILTAKSIDKRKSLYKSLQKSGIKVLEFKATREQELADWIQKIASSNGKQIGGRAVETLIQNVGGNLAMAAMEVKKLVSYVGEGTEIEPRHVEELVGRSRVDSAFDLSNAIGSRDAGRALSILGTLLDEGESEIGIVALLRWQFMRILKGKDLESRGIAGDQIPAQLGVRYFKTEFLDVLRGFDFASARRAYLSLFDADVSLRGKMLGNRYILENLVISLCEA